MLALVGGFECWIQGGLLCTYGVVDDILGAGVIVDVDGDAAQGGDFGGELFQTSVVLALALVCLGHGGRFVWRRGVSEVRRGCERLLSDEVASSAWSAVISRKNVSRRYEGVDGLARESREVRLDAPVKGKLSNGV